MDKGFFSEWKKEHLRPLSDVTTSADLWKSDNARSAANVVSDDRFGGQNPPIEKSFLSAIRDEQRRWFVGYRDNLAQILEPETGWEFFLFLREMIGAFERKRGYPLDVPSANHLGLFCEDADIPHKFRNKVFRASFTEGPPFIQLLEFNGRARRHEDLYRSKFLNFALRNGGMMHTANGPSIGVSIEGLRSFLLNCLQEHRNPPLPQSCVACYGDALESSLSPAAGESPEGSNLDNEVLILRCGHGYCRRCLRAGFESQRPDEGLQPERCRSALRRLGPRALMKCRACCIVNEADGQRIFWDV